MSPNNFQRFYVNEALVIRRSQGSDNVIVYLIDTIPNFCSFENLPPTADEVLQNIDKINEVNGHKEKKIIRMDEMIGKRYIYMNIFP